MSSLRRIEMQHFLVQQNAAPARAGRLVVFACAA